SVYFFKVLHQRWRFAWHGLITKTMVTYLFAAIGAGLFVRHFMDEALPYIPALLLAAMVFFRAILAPVTEDLRKDSFLLLPEPIWSKLFFSLAGGACNCTLDVAAPLVAGSIAAGLLPFQGLAYLPALVTADFFASSAGAFADVSIPPSIGVNLKQVAKVLLLYVGLIFDGMVLTYGIGTGSDMVGFALASALNLLFGATFLGLAGVWLHPRHGQPAAQDALAHDAARARKTYARVGLALAGMFVAVHGGQRLLGHLAPSIVATYLPVYVLGPLAFVALAGSGDARPKTHPLKVREALALLPACLFAAYAGNIVGYGLQGALDALFPWSLLPKAPELGADHMGLYVALATLASPIMEELVFRRCLINRLLPFGERAALVVSALAFGLFHGTANQLCYGALLGLVFGYVYLRTGRLRYSMGIHITINALSSVVLPALLFVAARSDGVGGGQVLLSSVILEPGVLALVVYVALLLAIALLGSVFFAYGVSERTIMPGGIGIGEALASWGMVVFEVLAVGTLLL
ncbi:MAG: putative ABC exporter domain-containing protein, partial [Coriobacteriales bacterium]|nr:putative ABC exporter domain-containing protein [Coriobacteriales bacterium]